MQAISIKFTMPTRTRPARVEAEAQGAITSSIDYDEALTLEQNAQAALSCFTFNNGNWAGHWTLASLDGGFVAVMIPDRFIRARDAVILARRAISSGESNGNAHAKLWGQAITDLTDGNQPDGFVAEYAAAVSRGL